MTVMLPARPRKRSSSSRGSMSEAMNGRAIVGESSRDRTSSEVMTDQLRLDAQQPPNSHESSSSNKQVRQLFGREVGPCVASFSCSHSRIPGRLYATSRALLFYSSLFGFERRIYLLHQDILDVELFRTTSISIRTSEFEVYVFKGFSRRERVHEILTSLLSATADGSASQGNNNDDSFTVHHQPSDDLEGIGDLPPSGPLLRRSTSAGIVSRGGTMAFPRRIVSSSALARPTMGNRRRSVSDSVVAVHDAVVDRCNGPDMDDDFVSDDPLSSLLPPPPEEEASTGWDDIKKGDRLAENGVELLVLPCSLDEFFEMFLSDKATFSLVRYQSEYVKDREVDATQWSTCHDGNSVIMARTITFTHPIKTSMGLGPSEARTTRTQRLTRCTDQGILLENVTGVDGIPGADSFRVNDRWVIEPAENEKDSLRLSSSFEIEFTKRSLFRSIIEKNIKKETGDWWKGYARMLQEALADAAKEREVANVLDKDRTEAFSSPNFSAQLEALTRSTNRLLTIIVFLLAAIVIMLGVNLAMAHQELALMRNILETESRQCTIPPEVVGMQSE